MSNPTWTAVDDYLESHLIADDDVTAGALERSRAAGLPDIAVSPTQAKLLETYALLVGARRVLEFGTLGGYSAIGLARVLPGEGRLITFEIDPHHAAVARANLDAAGVGPKVEIRVGAAADLIAGLEGEEPFDLTFIDADKANNPGYFRAALSHSRVGAVIIVDNVVRHGVIAAPSDDPGAAGSRAVIELAAHEARVCATVVQTVGRKGYDGFLVAVVIS